MFARLGIAGACSLLGGVSLLMCAIPFIFLWQGEKIRANSKFCLALRRRSAEMAAKIEDQRRRKSERLSRFSGSGSGADSSGSVQVDGVAKEEV